MLERGYTVAEVSQRLGVPAHSLYKWVKAVKPDKSDEQAAELVEAKSEILRLWAQMRRIEEERDILKRPLGTLLESPSKVPLHQRSPTPIQYNDGVSWAPGGSQRVLSMAA